MTDTKLNVGAQDVWQGFTWAKNNGHDNRRIVAGRGTDAMKYSKYIVSDGDAVIFPEHWDHAETARRLNFKADEIEGAGFVSFGEDGEIHCYGESISLKIKSRAAEDSFRVKKTMGYSEF